MSDTRPVKGAKTPWLWEMREEHQAPILENSERLYGSVPDADFGDRLMELAARAVGETYREALHDLEYDIGDSFLDGAKRINSLDDLNLDVRFRDTLTASVQYTLLTRCGEEDAQTIAIVGKYGMLRQTFLQEHHKGTYTSMLLTNRLWAHLLEIDRTAQARVDTMLTEMMKQNGVDEKLKASDQMKWVQEVNSLKAQAEEIVLSELVCN